MEDTVLLVLNALNSDDDKVAIEKFGLGRDVIATGPSQNGDEKLVDAAFQHAVAAGEKVMALQVLSSSLYHWGRQDTIISGPGKTAFLLYVRELVLKRGKEKAEMLEKKAQEIGLRLDIRMIESEDLAETVVQEARKGYNAVFLPKERKKLFPLIKRQTLEEVLRKNNIENIIVC